MRQSVHFYNTKYPSINIPLTEVILKMGERKRNGFYVPEHIPSFTDSLIYKNPPPSFREVAFETARAFFQSSIPEEDLYTVIADAFSFRVPVFPIDPRTYVIELTHGSSGSALDFGARFTIQLLSYLYRNTERPLHVLYAGEADAVMAIADSISSKNQIACTLLYPQGSLSHDAEQRLLAFPKNIQAFSVDGSLDMCRNMVYAAAESPALRERAVVFLPDITHVTYFLSYTFCCIYAALTVLSRSGYDNSIEIPQLLMGMTLTQRDGISAAVLAQKMKAPIKGFIAATVYDKEPPPDSFDNDYERLKLLHGPKSLHTDIALYHMHTNNVIEAMRTCNNRTGYIISPKGAEVWRAWNAVRSGEMNNCAPAKLPEWLIDTEYAGSYIGIIMEPMHPALCSKAIKDATGRELPLPYRFECSRQSNRKPHVLPPSIDALIDSIL